MHLNILCFSVETNTFLCRTKMDGFKFTRKSLPRTSEWDKRFTL